MIIMCRDRCLSDNVKQFELVNQSIGFRVFKIKRHAGVFEKSTTVNTLRFATSLTPKTVH